MSIPFVQYLRPNGTPRDVSVDRPAKIEAMARAIRAAGGRFECEILMTGDVSLTVEVDDDEGETITWAIEVVPNGPEVLAATDRLVADAHAAMLATAPPETKGATE